MHTDNRYWYFKNSLTPEQCKRIIHTGLEEIEKLKQDGEDTTATTFGDTQKQANEDKRPLNDKSLEEFGKDSNLSSIEVEKKTYIRDSEVSWLRHQWIYDLILPFLHEANKNSGWKYDLGNSEPFQFTVYKPGGFYGWHIDGDSCHNSAYKRFVPGISPEKSNGQPEKLYTTNLDNIGKVRKLSMTINLNDPEDYEGGDLKFDFGPHTPGNRYHKCVEIRPQGSIIVFPSYTYHQVTPITRGVRYSLVLWTLGKPFR